MLRIFRGAGLDFASLVNGDTLARAYRAEPVENLGLRSYARACLQVLVRRAVLTFRQRGPLARLALSRRRSATGDAAVERPGLDLRLDERACRRDALADRPRNLGLRGDREVAPDVLEQSPFGLREVERVGRESLHRLLARVEHLAAVFEAGLGVDVWVYKILDRAVDRPRVLIHTGLDLKHSLVGNQYLVQPINPPQSFVKCRLTLASASPTGRSLNSFGPVTKSPLELPCEETLEPYVRREFAPPGPRDAPILFSRPHRQSRHGLSAASQATPQLKA